MRSIADAPHGVPAHVTLLWPFAAEDALGPELVAQVAAIVARHPALDVTLASGERFPDTLYASVEPDPPIRALQAELAAAFPTLPLYDGEFGFTPHVSVVEDVTATHADEFERLAAIELPVTQRVHAVDLITTRAGRWATRRQFPLGGAVSG